LADAVEKVPKPVTPKKVEKKKPAEVAPTIRIDVGKVGALQDLAGELLIARMRADQIASKYDNEELSEVMTAVYRLTSNLQHTVLTMRMSPVDYLFGKFPRLVRDMSKKEGKEINLIVKGKEIALDRLVMDDINDVVVHLLRNAVDHGIETPEQRAQVGKKRGGTIKLIARREGDYVIIEVSDDGKGIDTEAVKKAAVEKGFIPEDEAPKLSTEEVFGLLGASGLSTLKEATEFSGRGVGFDVVRSKINSLGGTLRIQSEKNVGTKVTLKLPLTTAIIQSLMVFVGGETYAVPLGSVQEVVAIGEDDLKTIQRREIIKHRGKIVPVLRLRDLLGVPGERKIGPTMIVEQGEGMVGLMVDFIAGQQKTVVKPLAGVLEGRKEFAGATILPNGRVALILDVPGLVG
jgi:two-component system chemotaxis sensor kinase CheA